MIEAHRRLALPAPPRTPALLEARVRPSGQEEPCRRSWIDEVDRLQEAARRYGSGLSARYLDHELKAIEAEMERSPHGKSTDVLRSPGCVHRFLDGPPRPDREQWERFTGLWLAAALREAGKPHNTNKRNTGRVPS